jgi:hypothetical protein
MPANKSARPVLVKKVMDFQGITVDAFRWHGIDAIDAH